MLPVSDNIHGAAYSNSLTVPLTGSEQYKFKNMNVIQIVICTCMQRQLWPRWVDGHKNGRSNELKTN